jgi:hypothetical protein
VVAIHWWARRDLGTPTSVRLPDTQEVTVALMHSADLRLLRKAIGQHLDDQVWRRYGSIICQAADLLKHHEVELRGLEPLASCMP